MSYDDIKMTPGIQSWSPWTPGIDNKIWNCDCSHVYISWLDDLTIVVKVFCETTRCLVHWYHLQVDVLWGFRVYARLLILVTTKNCGSWANAWLRGNVSLLAQSEIVWKLTTWRSGVDTVTFFIGDPVFFSVRTCGDGPPRCFQQSDFLHRWRSSVWWKLWHRETHRTILRNR